MAKKFIRAVFPGSFDPITNGHLDVIRRGIKLFDEMIVAVGNSPVKEQLFTLAERVEMIKPLVKDIPGVSVQSYDCLTVEYAASVGATAMLRGLRNLTDVQYEFQLAMTNRAVAGIETVFVMTGEQYGFTSSTLIREIARLGGNVSNLIPQEVFAKLQKRLAEIGIKQERDNCIE
jgi:pantetheine-phosphate adenylyltransferase